MSKVSNEYNLKNEKRAEDAMKSIYRALEGNFSKNIRDILEDVFKVGKGSYSGSILDRLGSYNTDILKIGRNSLSVNIFPSRGPTSHVYEEFVCICAGETKFFTALESIIDYCHCAESRLPIEINKRVLLITNQWNEKTFAKFKCELGDFCITENIDFYFFLVTDYGVTNVPFLFIPGQNHYKNQMNFFAGKNCKYKQFMKNIGRRIVAYELCLDIKLKKLYNDGVCICKYIPKELLYNCIFDLATIQGPETVSELYPDIDNNLDDEYCYESECYRILNDLINDLADMQALECID